MITIKKLRLLVKKKKLNKEELKSIREYLEEASKKYYNTDEKILTDSEYDYLYDRYINLGGEPFMGAEPSTQDNDLLRITESEHNYQELVGTTLKAHNLKEFNGWLEKMFKELKINKKTETLKLCATLKFDGNSILIEYDKDGKVSRALTRGRNGKGVDLTKVFKHKSFRIKNIYKIPLAIKYECLLRFSRLKDIEETFGKEYKNPRNGVAGMLNGSDAIKYRDFYTLEPIWMKFSEKPNNMNYKEMRDEELSFFENNLIGENYELPNDGLPDTNYYSYFSEGNFEEIKNDIEEVYNEVINERSNLDFMIDGIVIDIISSKYREKLGFIDGGENLKPKWCIAIKFPYEEQESIVTDIKFSIGDSGRISPVCYFEPVTMSNNTTHFKQYLQGYKRFKELQLCKGTRIAIQYHNDTLSYVERLDTIEDDKVNKRIPIPFIKECPICGEPIKIVTNEFGEETFAYCINEYCPARSVGKINNYFKKMDIKGIKTSTIEKLHKSDLWNKIEDIYTFDYEKAYKIEGLGKTSIDKIIKSIERKKYYDYEIIGSLGIKSFGLDTSKSLCNVYSLEEMMNYITEIKDNIEDKTRKIKLKNKLRRNIESVEGISEILSKYIVQGLIKNYYTIQFLMKRGYKMIKDEQIFDENRYSFVITGDLNTCNRDEMKKILERHGHKLIGSVSNKTDYLVTNSPNSGTVKNKKAKELGKPIITEEELIKLLNLNIEEELKVVKQKY